MDQHGSPCCFNFLTVTSSYYNKVNLISALDAEILAAAVLIYVFSIGFPMSLLSEKEEKMLGWILKKFTPGAEVVQ